MQLASMYELAAFNRIRLTCLDLNRETGVCHLTVSGTGEA